MRGIRSKLPVHALTVVALTWCLVSSVTRSLTGNVQVDTWFGPLTSQSELDTITAAFDTMASRFGSTVYVCEPDSDDTCDGHTFGVRFLFSCVELTHLCLCSLFIRRT